MAKRAKGAATLPYPTGAAAVREARTLEQAYSTVWDIQMKLQHALPRSVVYYGQDTLKDGGTRYDELGVFLPLEHFADRLERHVETATKIVYGE